jgi:hypothetical protein
MMLRTLALLLAAAVAAVGAQVTIYNQTPLKQASRSGTASAAAASYTVHSVYDLKVLDPPALPSPMPALAFTVWMNANNQSVANLSIPVPGNFFGFSVEFSVVNQVREYRASYLLVRIY